MSVKPASNDKRIIDRTPVKSTSKYYIKDDWVLVKKAKTGLGIFANKDIPKGECVLEYVGKIISEEDAVKSRSKYLFEINSKLTIDGTDRANRARYINHGCIPNCVVEKYRQRIFILTDKKIKVGEELTFDYGKEYFDEFIKPHGCKCVRCVKD